MHVVRVGEPGGGDRRTASRRSRAATLPEVTLATGLLSALLLGWSIREGQISRRRRSSLETSNLALNVEIQTRIKRRKPSTS